MTRSVKEMLRKHLVQSPPGTLRLFCWVFCLNLFSQESTFKKSYRKRNVSVFISGVPDGGRCEDRAGSLRPLQPVRLFPEPHRAWDSKGLSDAQGDWGGHVSWFENPPLVILIRLLSPSTVSLPAPSWKSLFFFIYLFGRAGSLVVACKLLVVACMWDPVPWLGIEPGSPTLEAWSLNHCTTWEVPEKSLF